jgi:23S rRNA (uracil1939-C5)-methyltransferase
MVIHDSFIVAVEKLLYGGDALARRGDGKAVFIPCAVPGDRLLVRPSAEKKNYIRAEILEILTPGEGRVTPECRHFGKCGGCGWQQIEYPRQAEAKRRILEELFYHRFPETRRLTVTMDPCPRPFGYRSRARVRRCVIPNRQSKVNPRSTIHNPKSKMAIGFFRGGTHSIEDIENCPLFRPRLNDALLALRHIPFEQFKTKRSDNIQEIDIASSEEDGTWAIAKNGDETLLRRKIGDFTYNVAAGTFFQANDFMIGALVSHVMNCVSRNSGTALDLFSGAGLFSLPLARRFRAVTAVEYSRESHSLCAMNAAGAGIENLETICADAAGWLNLQTASRFDGVVLDPPRAGAGSGVMEQTGRLASKAIVYVSCDPQTLVRDLEHLNMDCWRIVSVAGFDMFPQTYHFETVVHLERV